MTVAEESRNNRAKITATSLTTNSTQIGLGLNPGLQRTDCIEVNIDKTRPGLFNSIIEFPAHCVE
jgi:hypothetical protein